MNNELLFIAHSFTINIFLLLFAKLNKSALIAYISLLFVLANIFVLKQINLFGLCATSADAFIIGISFGINLLQEFYGKAIAQKAIYISFISSFFYFIMTKFNSLYIASHNDTTHQSFLKLASFSKRIIIASIASYFITQLIDIFLYSKIKKQLQSRFFILRNYFSICISQLIDTILFSFLALYGITSNIYELITISYSLKLLALLLSTPLLFIAKKFLNIDKK